MSKPKQKTCQKSRSNRLLLLLLILFAAEVFYIISSKEKMNREYELLHELKSLKTLEQKIEGLFKKNIEHQSFDSIAKDSRDFNMVLELMEQHPLFNKEDGHQQFQELNTRLQEDFSRSQEYIERYKSWSGLTINSTRVLFDMHGYIKNIIRKQGSSKKEHEIEGLLDEVIVMVALISYDQLSERAILMEKLEALKQKSSYDKKLSQSIHTMQKHVNVLLQGEEVMQELKQLNANLHLGESIDRIYELLLQDFKGKDRENLFNIYVMNAVVLFLLILLFYISRKESNLHEKVCLLNYDLEDNIQELEHVNKEIKKLLKKFDRHVIASETDTAGIITYASAAFCEVSGYTLKELLGKPHNIVRHPDVPKEVYREMWETIQSGREWSGEIKNRRKDGGYYWVEVFVSPEFDQAGRIVGYGAIRNLITPKKELEELSHSLEKQVYERTRELEVMMEKVQKLSITDELTGIYNRRYYTQIIDNEIRRAKRNQQYFGYLILDIDNFKRYNDNYGHQQGDQVLIQVAKRLEVVLERPDDFVFRLGGEEFLVIFTSDNKQKAEIFAQHIIDAIGMLNIEHAHNENYHIVTLSGGLVVCEPHESCANAEELYRRSDELLYEAKAAGRNCLRF